MEIEAYQKTWWN